jgi:hypothetical protein
MKTTPPFIETEVVPPGEEPNNSSESSSGTDQTKASGGQSRTGNPSNGSTGVGGNLHKPAMFHPLSATLLLTIDLLWTFADWALITWFVTIPLSFLTVFVPTFLVQWRMNGDSPGRAFLKALLLGVLAAVPTAISGTPVGLALLAWAGIRRMR